jgi:Leucine-rich repeat (LRR) protein
MLSADLLRYNKSGARDKKTNLSHVNNYNGLGQSLFSSNSMYNISNRRTLIIKNVIPNNLLDQQFIDTLKSLQELKNSLKSGKISQSQFLLDIRKIKIQSKEINALFKPDNEFNYWFTNNDYRTKRMTKIIEYLEATYPAENLENFVGQLEVWVNEAPDGEKEARSTARSRILDAYNGNLNGLTLDSLGLTRLPIGVLNYLTKLEWLDLSNNQLRELPDGVFNGLTNLGSLRLFNNKLRELPDGVFNGLTNLRDLRLIMNKLRELPEGIFNGLTKLKSLDLSHNQLSELHEGIFNELTKLECLDLTGNQLREFPAGVSNGLTKLRSLDLSNNPIVLHAGIFNGLTGLENLRLTNNSHLSELPDGVFNGLTALTHLELYHNQLSVLHAGVFNGLTNLTNLKLFNNQLSVLHAGVFNELTKLEELSLYRNQLSELPDEVFNGLTKLRFVNLEQNRFSFRAVNQIRNSFQHSNMRIAISVHEEERTTSITDNLTIMNRLNEILKQARSKYQLKLNWDRLDQDGIFNAFLKKVPQMADVKDGSKDKAAAVYGNLATIIRAMDKNPELRETCFNIAHESTQTCGDRVAFGYIQMQLQVKLHKPNPSLSELITQQKAMCALEIIFEIAGAKAKSARGVIDEIEVYLTYIKHLKDYLQVEITGMLYESLSDIKQSDINAARERLRETLTDDYVYTALVDSDIVKKRYAREFEEIQAQPEFDVESKDGESGWAYQERMKNLGNRFKEAKVNFLREQLSV